MLFKCINYRIKLLSQKRLTVFTPAYNREKLLPRLYDSLVNQTCKDFVWLVVDDGSTDNTRELIESYKAQNEIEIEYIYRENGGKMRAHNDGVRNAKTPFFLCVDSDDYLVKDAVFTLLSVADKYDIENSANLAGIISHKGESETKLLSGVNFKEGTDKSTLYNLYLNGFKGETTIMFLTKVIAKYPFPEIEGEKYVPEDYIYDKIDCDFEYIILDKITTVCELVSEGYTDSVIKLKKSNPKAFYLYYKQRALITPLSILKIKYLGFYVKYAKLTGQNIFDIKLNKLYVIAGILASVFINE